MKDYKYGRIKKLATCLTEAGIDEKIIGEIMEGGELIVPATTPAKKAAWLQVAMERMNALLDAPTRNGIRQACACCLGGKRFEISKGIAKSHGSLEDRIEAANKARFVFGHSVTLQDDGKVLVSFFPEDATELRCPCLPKAEERMSITYCYCCGGHVKHHLETALGRKTSVQVMSSVLSSSGKNGCKFLFTIEE